MNIMYIKFRLKNGMRKLIKNRDKKTIAMIAVYAIIVMACVLKVISAEENITEETLYGEQLQIGEFIVVILKIIVVTLIFLYLMGRSKSAEIINKNIKSVALNNKVKESPLLINHYEGKNGMMVMEFLILGSSPHLWQDKQSEIESALNIIITDIRFGNTRNIICVSYAPVRNNIPDYVPWNASYYDTNEYSLVLGQGIFGLKKVDLCKIPHMLIGGSTGSGKTILLKALLWQCSIKYSDIYIADFKGGVDYGSYFKRCAHIITDETQLIMTLQKILLELEDRKQLLVNTKFRNIKEYNDSAVSSSIPHIILAIDEYAEIADKTGLSKEKRKNIEEIESMIATIARLGRAFGIHLIICTQRPDATLMSGQIRNNIDFRICGRADDVLSKIILDNTDASEKIPKSEQGLFLCNDGEMIRGFDYHEEESR